MDELYSYAKIATEARKHFAEKAQAAKAEEAARADPAEEGKEALDAPALKR